MRFMMMTTDDGSSAGTPPSPEMYAEMGKLIEEMTKAGVLLATGGLAPHPTRIKSSGGKVNVTDGPFTEAKEVVGGYAIVEVKSRDEALKIARDFMELHQVHWPSFEGESEVRPLEDY